MQGPIRLGDKALLVRLADLGLSHPRLIGDFSQAILQGDERLWVGCTAGSYSITGGSGGQFLAPG